MIYNLLWFFVAMSNTKNSQSYLSFKALDYLLEKPSAEYREKIQELKFHRIGPMVEYYLYDKDVAPSLYRKSASVGSTLLLKMAAIKTLNDLPAPTTSHSYEVEFFKCPCSEAELEDARYDAFLNRLRHAAGQIGLERTFTAALTATFGEMVNNLVIHSSFPQTAIIGYRLSLIHI